MKPAILIVGHGSRDREGTQEFQQLVDLFGAQDPGRIVECGFLEFAEPVIQAGVDRCVARGATRVLLVPYLLLLGGHVRRDLPRAATQARRRHRGLLVRIATHLGDDPRLVAIVTARARRGLRSAGWR